MFGQVCLLVGTLNRRDTLARGVLLLVSLCGLVVAGCNRAAPPSAAPKSGQELLDRMVKAYQSAKTYADSGEARLQYDAEEHFDSTFNFSVALARPNKLRMHFYKASVLCDGKELRATIEDLPNQMLSVPASSQLTTEEVYGNETLTNALVEGPAGGPVQLAMLLDKDPLIPILQDAQTPVLLPSKEIDESPCYGVEIARTDGRLVFWIDQATYVLRRIEFPLNDLQAFLSEKQKVRNLSLVADLKGARFDVPIADVAFEFEIPPTTRLVKEFETVPRPEPPSPLLGKPVPEFKFVGLDGQPITRESLHGKIAVLDFWATWCGPCFQSFPNLEQVYRKYSSNDKVVILAVSIDVLPPTGPRTSPISTGGSQDQGIADQALRDAFSQSKLSIPITRDPKQFALAAFGIQQIPNMFILGADGTVQDQELGYNPELARELPERLDKLLAGQSIAADCQSRYEARLREYENQFRAAAQTGAAETQRAKIATSSEPVTLKLKKLWACDALQQPGNLLVVDNPQGEPEILASDGWSKIVRLNVRGDVLNTYTLDLPKEPEEGIVSFLRAATDSDGRRLFVGAASSRQQMHVFDADFKRLYSYPDGTSVGGIADVEVGDLDGDGHPEFNVSYYDVVGVQNVALDGRRRWANRALANCFRTAVTGPDQAGHRHLLCANERGSLVPIDYQGHEGQPITIGQRFIRAIFSADLNADAAMEYCGIGVVRTGEETLVGIDLARGEIWNYPLPEGMQHHAALEMVASGNVVGTKQGQWVVAGADGSLHVLAADGTPIDHWNYGNAISGLAVTRNDGPVLVVATAKNIEAWKVEPR